MNWIDANERVPEFFKFTGCSLPVLVIAETGDACFQTTMAVYSRGSPRRKTDTERQRDYRNRIHLRNTCSALSAPIGAQQGAGTTP